MNPQLSAVVPCYNEAGNLEQIVERFRALAGKIALELILVDNGSTDDSAGILAHLLSRPENSFARKLGFPLNRGYGYGLQRGLESARAPVVAFTHADLQCPVEDILRAHRIYLEESPRGPCLVMGRRAGRRAPDERAVSWCYNRLAAWALGLSSEKADSPGRGERGFPDLNAQPKLFGRDLVGALLEGPPDFTFDLFVLDACRRANARILEFRVDYLDRAWGHSKLAANRWRRAKNAAAAFLRIVQLRLNLR